MLPEESRKRKRLQQEHLDRMRRLRDLTALLVVLAGCAYLLHPQPPAWLLPVVILLGIALNFQILARALQQERTAIVWGSIVMLLVLTGLLIAIILLA